MENKTNDRVISNKESVLLEFLFSFVLMCVSYYLYMTRYINYNNELKKQITTLLTDINIDSSVEVMYILYAICMLILLFVGFVIYKIIFKIISCKIGEMRLILSIMTAYAVSFIIGYVLVTNISFILTTLICNAIEMFIVFAMNYDVIKQKIVPAFIIRSILIIINIMMSFAL